MTLTTELDDMTQNEQTFFTVVHPLDNEAEEKVDTEHLGPMQMTTTVRFCLFALRGYGHPGAIRLLSFLNHTNSGTYADAIHVANQTGTAPDVTATRRTGTLKYGFGVNLEQEITKNIGVFARLGWNDGKTESFAFTAIDRLASGGVSVNGAGWKRPFDTAATALTVSGISGVHAAYLARGGQDFNIGDGSLRYAPEYVSETYYGARLVPGVFATLDIQRVVNPAFNRDRGPVWIPTLRLHVELSKDIFLRKRRS